MSSLTPGLEASLDLVVDEGRTAAALGSGLVAGLATPAMIALMEGAAVLAVEKYLESGFASVGTRVEVDHMAPTPVGMRVTARARLERVEGRRLLFSIEAKDEIGPVGMGFHERVIVKLATFEEKLATRGTPPPGRVGER